MKVAAEEALEVQGRWVCGAVLALAVVAALDREYAVDMLVVAEVEVARAAERVEANAWTIRCCCCASDMRCARSAEGRKVAVEVELDAARCTLQGESPCLHQGGAWSGG